MLSMLNWFSERMVCITCLSLGGVIPEGDVSAVTNNNLTRVKQLNLWGPAMTDQFVQTVSTQCPAVSKISFV